MAKKRSRTEREHEDLCQQLVQSRAAQDDSTRTAHQLRQELLELRSRLANADDMLIQKASMVACLQEELAASDQRHGAEMERYTSELNEVKRTQILERDTVNRKIEEIVQRVREKEDELETVVASITTHDLAMQAKDRLIAGLEDKLAKYQKDLEEQTSEVVAQRQTFSGLQRDAESGRRQVIQLTASLQQCQTQLDLHLQEAKAADSMRSNHHKEISRMKAKVSQLERSAEDKSLECRQVKASKLELEAELAQLKHTYSYAEQRRQDVEASVHSLKSDISQMAAQLHACQGDLTVEKEHSEELATSCRRQELEKKRLLDETRQRSGHEDERYSKLRKETRQLEASLEKHKEQLAQAQLKYEQQWQREVELTERLTATNADLLMCRKELQEKQVEITHVELQLEGAKSQLHHRDAQCADLKAIVDKQKQSMRERASQVNQLVLSVQNSQRKQQDEVDALHSDIRQLQTQLQASQMERDKNTMERDNGKTTLVNLQKELQLLQESSQTDKISLSALQTDLRDNQQKADRLAAECTQLRAQLNEVQGDRDDKTSALQQSERKRQTAERHAGEMEDKLRSIHHRLTTTSSANNSLSEELSKANELVKTGDEVSLKRVHQLEQQLFTIQKTYQDQVSSLQAKHSEVLLALEDRERSHRLEMNSQVEVLERMRQQEAEAQLTAAQCSAELVRVKKQLHWFQREIVLKDSTMKAVDLKVSDMEQSILLNPKPAASSHPV